MENASIISRKPISCGSFQPAAAGQRAAASYRARGKIAMRQSPTTTMQHTVEMTNAWLAEIAQRLGDQQQRRAYLGLRAVLHALRDRLSADDAAHLAAQLPMLVRGIFYEGYRPSGKPLAEHKKSEFLAAVRSECPEEDLNIGTITRAVLQVVAKHVSAGETDKIKAKLPAGVRELWE
jgi:uncharacterized protein (DUF2267 family)